MSIELQSKVSSLLSEIASRLDISPSKYKEAVERYNAVSNWITSGEFTGVKDIYFYPQGSFRLGTVIRPLLGGQDADYDIDLVCEMQVNKSEVIPRDLKQLIGNRLKENGKYKEMLDDEGRRCWTLLYAEEDGIGFHLDVLPAAPEQTEFRDSMVQVGVNPEYAELAIAITHKNKDES